MRPAPGWLWEGEGCPQRGPRAHRSPALDLICLQVHCALTFRRCFRDVGARSSYQSVMQSLNHPTTFPVLRLFRPPPFLLNSWRPMFLFCFRFCFCFIISRVLPFPKCRAIGITERVAFSAWILSLNKVSLRAIVVFFRGFLFIQIMCHDIDVPQFIYSPTPEGNYEESFHKLKWRFNTFSDQLAGYLVMPLLYHMVRRQRVL